jgi:hypothetical protein
MEHEVSRDLIAVKEKASPRAYRDACDFGAAAFAKSSIMSRTPTQQSCTPLEAAVTMAPKKKETTLLKKLRGTNAASTTTRTCEQSDEVKTASLSKNVV